ncbi:MAG: protein kinase [Treponema sp.]|jgi:serine/threonine protein kinase|nr:protein kinase [Treponema sp.]
MKKGDSINGYILQDNFKYVGQCGWTFASKEGNDFFIKEFLSPKYPLPESPGSEKTKKRKKILCEQFEKHHISIMNALFRKCSSGGNLIVTIDFFRKGTTYYKVTDKVDVSSITIDNISKLSLEKKLLILKTVSHSLQILHNANIVHGDLKPDNILIKRKEEASTEVYIAKLIDFDSSYFSGEPLQFSEDVIGDMVYYSPELGRYVEGLDGASLEKIQLKSDIFALGLIYHQYLSGNLPQFDHTKYRYSYSAVLDGIDLILDPAIPSNLQNLLKSMLDKAPNNRPSIKEVFDTIPLFSKISADREDKSPPMNSISVNESEMSGTLRGTLIKTNKLRGTLIKKKE